MPKRKAPSTWTFKGWAILNQKTGKLDVLGKGEPVILECEREARHWCALDYDCQPVKVNITIRRAK